MILLIKFDIILYILIKAFNLNESGFWYKKSIKDIK